MSRTGARAILALSLLPLLVSLPDEPPPVPEPRRPPPPPPTPDDAADGIAFDALATLEQTPAQAERALEAARARRERKVAKRGRR